MKQCRFCAEDVLDAAVVCKHCGRDLESHTPRDLSPKRPPSTATASSGAAPAHSQPHISARFRWAFFGSLFVLVAGSMIAASLMSSGPVGEVSPETRKFIDSIPDTSPQSPRAFTMTDFGRLRAGMGIDEVRSQLGSEGTLEGTSTVADVLMAVWVWRNLDGSAVSITFRDGSLVSKVQSGLR